MKKEVYNNDKISGNKIKGDNNQITINPQMPVTDCADIIKEREMEIEKLKVQNNMLAVHIDHLAKDVSRVRNILNEKDKYIAALIAKISPK